MRSIYDQVAKGLIVFCGFKLNERGATHEGYQLHESLSQQVVSSFHALHRLAAESDLPELLEQVFYSLRHEKRICGGEYKSTGMHIQSLAPDVA